MGTRWSLVLMMRIVQSVGINGDGSNNASQNSGAAYVFQRDGTHWSQQAYLKASNNSANDNFGYPVRISGNTVIAAAYNEDSGATGVNGDQFADSFATLTSGCAFVFNRTGNSWSVVQEAYAKALNSEDADAFGYSVAVSEDTVVVGAPYEDSNVTGPSTTASLDNSLSNSGAAYVFTYDDIDGWVFEAILKPLDPEAGDLFGSSVAVYRNSVVVGAPFKASNDIGAAYFFERSGTLWAQNVKKVGSDPNDHFGSSVAVYGQYAAVGVPGEDSSSGTTQNNSSADAGAVFVYPWSTSTWGTPVYVKASNIGAGDQFGSSVALWKDCLIVGAPFEDSNSGSLPSNNSATDSGAAYILRRSSSSWLSEKYLKGVLDVGDQFGTSVAITDDAAYVGAPFEDSAATGVFTSVSSDNSAPDSGAALVFGYTGSAWNLAAFVKASNAEAGDNFGKSVAGNFGTLLVGAPGEDGDGDGSDAPGAANNFAVDSGAMYAFSRKGTNWSQNSYIKASNSEAGDAFGSAVAISRSTVVVGSPNEDSDSIGINGIQTSNSAVNSGASYVFYGLRSDIQLGLFDHVVVRYS